MLVPGADSSNERTRLKSFALTASNNGMFASYELLDGCDDDDAEEIKSSQRRLMRNTMRRAMMSRRPLLVARAFNKKAMVEVYCFTKALLVLLNISSCFPYCPN